MGGLGKATEKVGLWVFFAQPSTMNSQILKAGYANLLTIPPNVQYKDRFIKVIWKQERVGGMGSIFKRKCKDTKTGQIVEGDT
jgi:hypothetical protein